jgi:hypothetical protein
MRLYKNSDLHYVRNSHRKSYRPEPVIEKSESKRPFIEGRKL